MSRAIEETKVLVLDENDALRQSIVRIISRFFEPDRIAQSHSTCLLSDCPAYFLPQLLLIEISLLWKVKKKLRELKKQSPQFRVCAYSSMTITGEQIFFREFAEEMGADAFISASEIDEYVKDLFDSRKVM